MMMKLIMMTEVVAAEAFRQNARGYASSISSRGSFHVNLRQSNRTERVDARWFVRRVFMLESIKPYGTVERKLLVEGN